MNSDVFIRKLHRAQEALSQSNGSGASSVKTLSASFGTKWPYKRTMSAPASIVSRHENKGKCLYEFVDCYKYLQHHDALILLQNTKKRCIVASIQRQY